MQKISIGLPNDGCRGLAVTMHEIGHAIGFWHEQSRPDRDDYVRILVENIEMNMASQFLKYSRQDVDSFEVPYDFNSIMHYSPLVSCLITHA